MNNNSTKGYYSVKEAARLLGVSNNTVYQYLKEGKIFAKRIGRGRIKIPYKELAPFLPQQTFVPENLEESRVPKVQDQEVPPSLPNNYQILSGSRLEQENLGVSDIIFWRLFRAVFLLGLGVIYLLIRIPPFDILSLIPISQKDTFLAILPFALILGGVFCLVRVVDSKRFSSWDFPIHIYLTLVLGYLSYICLTNQRLGLFIFVASLLFMVASHFARGFSFFGSSNFKSQFLKYSLMLTVLGGIILIYQPDFFPIESLVDALSKNKALFTLIWFSATTPFLLYALSPSGKDKRFVNFYLGGLALVSLIFSTSLILRISWDVSYLGFLSGVFGLTLVLLEEMKVKLDPAKTYNLIFSSMWISVSIVLGLFAIYSSQEKIKQKVSSQLRQRTESVVFEIESIIESQRSTLLTFATNNSLKISLKEKETEKLGDYLSEIYGKSSLARRVSVFDNEGIAVAAYPRNSLVEGTNFSSRDYFVKTKENLSPFISPVFKGVTGVDVVIQTEPVFEENKFIGLLGFVYSLKDFSGFIREKVGTNYDFVLVDSNGVVLASSDEAKIGSKVESFFQGNLSSQNKEILQSSELKGANWKFYLRTQSLPIIDVVSSVSIWVSLILVVNALVTILAGISLASEKNEEITKVRSTPFAEKLLKTA